MATVNVLPNGSDTTIPGGTAGWRGNGAGTVWFAMASPVGTVYASDDIVGGPSGHQVHLTFASVSLPANAVLQSVQPHMRIFESAAGEHSMRIQAMAWDPNTGRYVYLSPNAIWRDKPGGTLTWNLPKGQAYLKSPDSKHPGWTPQWVVDHLELLISSNPEVDYGSTGGHRVYAVSMDVTYNEQPTATGLVLQPSSAQTRTARPSVQWTYADPENDPQAAYSIVVWKTTDAADSKCPKATATSFTASDGTRRVAVGGALNVLSDDNQWQVPTNLPNGNYTAFVRVADEVGGTLRWSTQTGTLAWTQAVSLPPAPTSITRIWDPQLMAPKITVNVPSWTHTPATTQDVYVERSTDGGLTWDRLAAAAATDLPGQVAKSGIVTWDGLCVAGDLVRYRAQTSHDDGDFQFGSAYSTATADLQVMYSAFFLRDPTQPDVPPVYLKLGGPLEGTSDEQLGVFQPADNPYPVFVSGTVQARKFAVTASVDGEARQAALVALRGRQRVMWLQTDMLFDGRWVRFDATFDETMQMSLLRHDANRRPYSVSFTLLECAPGVRDDGTVIGA
jgi:hypothetical protein